MYLYHTGITQVSNATAVEGCDVPIPWQYPFPFKKVEWFEGGIDGALMMTYIRDSHEFTTSENFSITYINTTDSVGIVSNVKVQTDIYVVRVTITDLAIEESAFNIAVVSGK